MADPWNVNIHYDARLAACVPAGARSALDVGCGDGFLAARLARSVPLVVAIDADAAVLDRARARFADSTVRWCHGDVLTYPLTPGSFDAVVSNAALHHLPDVRAALLRLSELVRPGGVLAVVGFARMRWPDVPWAVAAFVARGIAIRVRGKWVHTAPTAWPPPDTYRQLRQAARDVLPGARIRRLLLGRYLMTWTSPTAIGQRDSHSARHTRTVRNSLRARSVQLDMRYMRASRPCAFALAALALTVTACGTISASGPGVAGSHTSPGGSGRITLTPSPAGSSSPGSARRHHHTGGGRTGAVFVTVADNGRTVPVVVGQVLVVVLSGQGISIWDRPRLAESAPGALRQLSAAGGYPSTAPAIARFLAVHAGTATLTSMTDARCLHSHPKCAFAQRLWRVTVVVSG